jgi:hypothetical protein
MLIQQQCTELRLEKGQEYGRCNQLRPTPENGVAMRRNAPGIVATRECYGAFPSELSTQYQIIFFDPKKL